MINVIVIEQKKVLTKSLIDTIVSGRFKFLVDPNVNLNKLLWQIFKKTRPFYKQWQKVLWIV